MIKDGYKDSRHATPDFPINEPVKAFKIPLSLAQARALEVMTDKYRRKAINGEIRYNAISNDTCAATARELLDSAGIKTPSGRGLVKYTGIIDHAIVSVINPYKWHEDFKGIYREASYKIPERPGIWNPTPGQDDPIFSQPNLVRKAAVVGASQ